VVSDLVMSSGGNDRNQFVPRPFHGRLANCRKDGPPATAINPGSYELLPDLPANPN
jgi:hypothetical protein